MAIVTGDKDFFQLVHDGLKVYNPKEEGTWYDAAGVKEKFGVAPEQVVDVLALMGDSIDNIKGVPGIGEKGARDLIAEYGDPREPARPCRPRSRTSASAKGCSITPTMRGRAARCAQIHVDCPVEFDPESMRYRGSSRERCFDLFTRLGFRTLVMDFAPTAQTVGKDYQAVDTIEAVTALAAELRAAGRFALRVLPDTPSAMRASIVGLSFSTTPRQARYVPFTIGSPPIAAGSNGGFAFDSEPERPAASARARRSTCCGRCSRIRRSRRSGTT